MRNSISRFSCRAGFVLFCLLPTLLVIGSILVTRSTFYRTRQRVELASRLSEVLGVDVAIERLESVGGDGVLLHGLRLRDPETARLLVTVRLLEVRETEGTLKLLASQPEVEASALGRLWELLRDRLLRDRDADHRVAAFAAQELTLRGAEQSQTFTEVRGTLEPSDSGPQLSLEFRLAGAEMTEPAQFRVVRNRQLSPPATGWALRTGNAALPCSLMIEQLPFLARLGPECRFQGSIWASRTVDGWEGDISGRLVDLDLYNLVSESFPHKLTGSAELLLTVARIQRGRLIEASGELRSNHGVISQSLLLAIRDELHLTLNMDALPVDEQRVLYRDLAVAFRLDQGGLSMAAVRESKSPGVLLEGDAGWLVAESAETTIPVVALVRALVPDSRLLVPASRQTEPLLHVLPIPDVVPESANKGRGLYSPLRLKTDGSGDFQ